MPATRYPPTSRGREKHVIALLVVADALPLEVVIAQQLFGAPDGTVGAITGNIESPYEVVLCGEQPRYSLRFGTDFGELSPLEVMLTADTVIVPGVENPLATRSEVLLDALRQAHQAGVRMVSFCGGAFLLGYAGILDRRRATTHWIFNNEFRTAFPHVRLEVDRLYVDDGPVHTSGGGFATTDLSLHLIALDRGQAVANDAGRMVVSAPQRPGGQAQFIKDSIRVDDQPAIGSLLWWVRDNVDQPLTLADLADHEHISQRTLIRKFRQATGMSVLDWINRERVSQAKVLVETTDFPLTEIAAMVGFGSAETLRRNFEKITGITAGDYRTTFRATAHSVAS